MTDDHFRQSIENARVPIDGEQIFPAWRLGDPDFEKDAIAFWNELGIMASEEETRKRAGQLVCVGYVNDVLAGVQTADIGEYPPLKQKFAFFRAAVAPAYRLNYLQVRMATRTQEILENWARDNPEEEVAGVAIVMEASFQANRRMPPVTPTNKTVLVGFNESGHQIRIKWFDHIRV